jgi:hypothetical protein
MTDEILFRHGKTLVRRQRLAPGEALPWHRDPFHRVSVVLSGDQIRIEFRDGSETLRVPVKRGGGLGRAIKPCTPRAEYRTGAV